VRSRILRTTAAALAVALLVSACADGGNDDAEPDRDSSQPEAGEADPPEDGDGEQPGNDLS
jgi:hypothetical protein